MKFPLYRIRGYVSTNKVGTVTYINTRKATYILDDSAYQGDYFNRRLMIRSNISKYGKFKLYPLNERCSNIMQVIAVHKKYTYSKFMDSTGTILSRVLTHKVTTEWKKCTCIPSKSGDYYAAIVKGEPTHFVLRTPAKFLLLATILGSRHVLDTSNTEPARRKSWIKL